MANFCSNCVKFIGSKTAVDAVKDLFNEISQKQERTNRYHMPDFIGGGSGYMEDIETSNDWINYETRWVPNLEVLEAIAIKYELDYIVSYVEPMAGLYGEAVRTAGETQWVNIDTYTQKGAGNNPAFSKLKEIQASLLLNQGPGR